MYIPEWMTEFATNTAGKIVMSEQPGEAIKNMRKRYGIKQQELSTLLDVRRETVSRVENGRVDPGFGFVRNLSKTLAVIEGVRTYRTKQMEVDFPFLTRICKEIGVPASGLNLIITIALEGYEKKEERIRRQLDV